MARPDDAERIRVFQLTGPDDWGSTPGSSPPLALGLALAGFIGLCVLVGAAGVALTQHAVSGWYLSLRRPPGTPPDAVFGLVWGVLYVMIGVSGWLAWQHCGGSRPLRLWGWQLALNAAWAPAFFGARAPLLGLVVLAALLPLIFMTMRSFATVHRKAAWLLAPYAVWSLYALYLNVGFCWLNPG